MFVNLQSNGPTAFPVGWGCTLLGCLSIAMIPLPFVFWRYGPRIREWSRYATSELQGETGHMNVGPGSGEGKKGGNNEGAVAA
jgi:DHA1 family multidrug resistance protein-like MFS transporter